VKKEYSVLFVGKSNSQHVQRALSFCQSNFLDVRSELGMAAQKQLPDDLKAWKGDYIFSYLSPWVIPHWLLERATRAALNFHPASPDYPGIGCYNFALYDGVDTYGATCHHMAGKVDTGDIVAVKRFRLFETDTVESIFTRTQDHLLSLFYDVIELIREDQQLPKSTEKWARKPYTRRDLNELATITPDMTGAEIKRRVRATTFGDWRPKVELHGFVFELKD
jgi:methionyl-tRNA formyltransferase